MNKFILLPVTAVTMMAFAAADASAYDWETLLKGAASAQSAVTGDKTGQPAQQTDDNTPKGSSILSGLASFIGDATGLNKLEAKDLVGTWRYVSPAVSFQSENLLNKAGGAAAATVIVDKITPYYEKFGMTRVVYTFNDDGTMKMELGRLSLSGTYSKNEDGSFTFDIQLLGRSVKQLQAFIVRQAKNICITFDASGLISLMNTVGSLTGNSTVQGLSSILNSYDGLTVGFELAKK